MYITISIFLFKCSFYSLVLYMHVWMYALRAPRNHNKFLVFAHIGE